MGEVVRLSGKIPDTAELLREAMLSQRFADVALCCTGGQRFLAHRLVLSAVSPYLQEVLLAHSKAGNCEPTTVVILPEVEAAELASLLGFVYTGTAMVPRPRLDAFLRAAETLRIPLPPLPPIVEEESKLSHRYAQCHRFSLCAGCCFPRKQQLEKLSPQQTLPGYTVANSPAYSNEGFPGPIDREPLNQLGILEEEYVDVTGSDDESARNQGQKGSFPAYSEPSGEDLSCREICCEWRRAKRSVVSNCVTASPWEQIVRLHHSPRSRHGPAHSQEEKPILPPSSGKLEISHPVSRLCDTIDADRTASKDETIEEAKEKELVKSDDNNNHQQHPVIIPQGPRISRNEHKCEECGKTFVTRASLKVHGRTHTGEKPFRCADCGKQFSQLRNYKYHRSVHEGTREFAATCPECGKYFNDRGYLSSHMKIHRNRKEYGCAECGKSFNQRVAYNMHVRIHTGLKPHQCEQCGKAFSRKMLLKQHLRTHSGERPYQCQVCHKAFADRSNMTLHTRLHSGLKPYQCTLCSKAFTKKHHLKTHLNYHTGTKPYSCSNCGLRFSQSSNMRTHFKKCTVNNPSGTKSSDAAGLTPPNSDQESSVLTPVPT